MSAARILTVIIRNDAPCMYAGDSPTYRTVQIELTAEQMDKLRFWQKEEEFSKCWIEPASDMRGEGREEK